MKTVSQHAYELLLQDATAYESMQRGILNYSKYAAMLIPTIEEKTLKRVSLGSIVVALGRIQKRIDQSPISKNLIVEDVSTQRALLKIAFTSSEVNLKEVTVIAKESWANGDLFIVSQNVKESAIITKEKYSAKLLPVLQKSMLFTQRNLVCVTMRLDKESISTPGTFYSLLKPLMPSRVNVIEIITGLGEISLIVDARDEANVTRSFLHPQIKF